MFITFEGGEGAGKSTQARRLTDALAASGVPALCTREPGGAPNAELLRALLLDRTRTWAPDAEIMLHFAARAEHVAVTIGPALNAGMVVVCDRFADSTMAYQGYGLGADRSLIRALTGLLPVMPDLTFVLRVSPAIAARRMADRRQALDRYEAMDDAFHARVARGFLDIAAAEPGRCVVVDADGDADAVHGVIRQVITGRLPAFA